MLYQILMHRSIVLTAPNKKIGHTYLLAFYAELYFDIKWGSWPIFLIHIQYYVEILHNIVIKKQCME